MKNIRKIRLSLVWGIPLLAVIFFGGIWMIFWNIIPEFHDLYMSSPVVRIAPVSPVVIFVTMLMPLFIAMSVVNAIPCKKSTLKLIENISLWAMVSGLWLAFFCLVVITPLQFYVMPKMGYSLCNILKGDPDKYSTGWVKNPDWCVRGKSRDWVKEQARLADTRGT